MEDEPPEKIINQSAPGSKCDNSGVILEKTCSEQNVDHAEESAPGSKCDNSEVISEKTCSEQNVDHTEAVGSTKPKDFSDLDDLMILEMKAKGLHPKIISNAEEMFYGAEGICMKDNPPEKIPKQSASGSKSDNSGDISEKTCPEQNVNHTEAASCTESKDFSDLYDLRIQEMKDIGAPLFLIRNAQKMFYGSKGISTNDHYPKMK